ncbi:MAG: toxin-antitoxin system TumE family protein [Candidatus Electronema sp. V4]|uniref:toxin-antitoxin system TumE family protein n=1 Tax=Candidatus Electronema sp. V4 TaxID=3454756 RepID=UPI0040556FB7
MNKYLTKIEETVRFCFLMAAYQLKIDRKTQDMAFISGQIDFVDGSTLDFKEFVEKTDEEIEKYKYGYNYRKDSSVLFRYDNALDPGARCLNSFPHHKHLSDGKMVASHAVSLEEVLAEILQHILSSWEH